MLIGKLLQAFRKDIVVDVSETLRFSETSVTISHLTWCKILEELNLHKDYCKNHKSHSNTTVYRSADRLNFIKLLPTLC
jgi:hypothetical protein